MSFKVDTSFLRYLTMGALGVRRVAVELQEIGFKPIELERYSISNKIWATKVKRLRLPDLLCVQTGLRVEVRAKSDLRIRMSDAPQNPSRVWDAGMSDDDIVALIACSTGPDGNPKPADRAMYFSVAALRESVGSSTLGPPKSASEGAERDRTWPAIVPTRPGRVVSATSDKLLVAMEGDGGPPRNQTYTLNGKHVYVTPGDRFRADTEILAGAPGSLADLPSQLRRVYDPLEHIDSPDALDRYAAVKALRFRPDLWEGGARALENRLNDESDARVALEAAATAGVLGLARGEERLAAVLSGESPELSMEAILILTELKTSFAHAELVHAADRFRGDERRQAAIWGLGKAGLKSYSDLLPYIADEDENAAYHAIVGFGADTPRPIIEELVNILIAGEPRRATAASEVLRIIGSVDVLTCLARAADEQRGSVDRLLATAGSQPPDMVRDSVNERRDSIDWLLATLGRLPPNMVREHLRETYLLERVEPMLLVAHGASWLATDDAVTDIAFLLKQNLL